MKVELNIIIESFHVICPNLGEVRARTNPGLTSLIIFHCSMTRGLITNDIQYQCQKYAKDESRVKYYYRVIPCHLS